MIDIGLKIWECINAAELSTGVQVEAHNYLHEMLT